MCVRAAETDPWQLDDVPDNFKTQDKCDAVVSRDSYLLQCASGWFLMQEPVKIWHDEKIFVGADINCFIRKMCIRAIETDPCHRCPCHRWTETCNRAVESGPWQLDDVLDNFKTQQKCNIVLSGDSYSLQYVSD